MQLDPVSMLCLHVLTTSAIWQRWECVSSFPARLDTPALVQRTNPAFLFFEHAGSLLSLLNKCKGSGVPNTWEAVRGNCAITLS